MERLQCCIDNEEVVPYWDDFSSNKN